MFRFENRFLIHIS